MDWLTDKQDWKNYLPALRADDNNEELLIVMRNHNVKPS